MGKPLMRIPYTELFAPPTLIPRNANTLPGAVAALARFLTAPVADGRSPTTVILSGAGLSVSSASPTTAAQGHAHPHMPTLELHGYLRNTVCVTCRSEFPRDAFQAELARLNPAWAAFLEEVLASGALETEDPDERRARGMRTNPDGDVDLPGAPYTTFRYPACPSCLAHPPPRADADGDGRAAGAHVVEVDGDGAWKPGRSTAGILKPAVVMFGESIPDEVKAAAEAAVDGAGRLLVLGTSLATFSAWRIAKRALDRGMPIAVVNVGGVRGEEQLFAGVDWKQTGEQRVRVELSTDKVLPAVVETLRRTNGGPGVKARREVAAAAAAPEVTRGNHGAFKDMLS
ncbi:NAD-dependent deacetylase sirtuin-4 [Verticillium dahliae VdLs.17]|uniref:NAD-dependent deacetylase sirtuin-4 n=1 Tax=Verticillium dahliae (strain VdLs.17 / ATCC MYA-4575 / FGSC 10137) TaxID=498257 RepID=G2X6N0_VERDV|nr:NAD-dependent deacetylase sirtuin-4 [Verticillium dahliae VdLs.17]EGY14648.1 NAD-dependent deacetylase sirtuin-4 [Verticillium dahliae VdLs.17]